MGLKPTDTINLDEAIAETIAEDDDKKIHYLKEILSGPARIEVIFNCEACGTPLSTPILLTYGDSDDGDDPRDSSIIHDSCTD